MGTEDDLQFFKRRLRRSQFGVPSVTVGHGFVVYAGAIKLSTKASYPPKPACAAAHNACLGVGGTEWEKCRD